jgi:hypothetical protein
VKLKKLTHLLVLVTNKSTTRFVKPSIIYFSAKNKEVYINTFLTKTSAHFFRKKSKYQPDWQNLVKLKENINEWRILVN